MSFYLKVPIAEKWTKCIAHSMHLVNHNGSDLKGSLNSHSSLGRGPGCVNFPAEHMDAAQLKNESRDPGNSNCCCSVPESYLLLFDLMDCSMPHFSVLHYLPKFTQTHAHWIGDAIQPSYPLLSSSPPAFDLSQHQGLFKWVSSSHQVAKVLEFQLQHQSFPASGSFRMSQLSTSGGQNIGVSASTSVLPMNTQDWSPLEWTGWISLQSKGLKSLLQHCSSKASILQRSAFFIVQLSHPYMTTGKIIALPRWTFVDNVSVF